MAGIMSPQASFYRNLKREFRDDLRLLNKGERKAIRQTQRIKKRERHEADPNNVWWDYQYKDCFFDIFIGARRMRIPTC